MEYPPIHAGRKKGQESATCYSDIIRCDELCGNAGMRACIDEKDNSIGEYVIQVIINEHCSRKVVVESRGGVLQSVDINLNWSYGVPPAKQSMLRFNEDNEFSLVKEPIRDLEAGNIDTIPTEKFHFEREAEPNTRGEGGVIKGGGLEWRDNPAWEDEILLLLPPASATGEAGVGPYEVIRNPLWEEKCNKDKLACGGEEEIRNSEEICKVLVTSTECPPSWETTAPIYAPPENRYDSVTWNPLWEETQGLRNLEEGLGSEQCLSSSELDLSIECWRPTTSPSLQVMKHDPTKFAHYGDYQCLPSYVEPAAPFKDGYYYDDFQEDFELELLYPGFRGMLFFMYQGYSRCLRSVIKAMAQCIMSYNNGRSFRN